MKIKAFTFNPFGETTYVVWDEVTLQGAIVDPGMSSEYENRVLDQFISDNDIHVKYLINTHLHIDHVLGNGHVERHYGVKTSANERDQFLGDSVALQARHFRLNTSSDNVEVKNKLSDGDVLTLGKERLIVIETPGHSPGSISLYCPEGGFLLSGDTLFRRSVGRTDLEGGDAAALVKSIREKLFPLPPQTVVLPGHGPKTSIREEVEANPFV